MEYGFAMQGWMLRHFRILAVMESAAEPWFTDARVKTCATILQRCDDEEARTSNLVRFVRFDRRLVDIVGVPPGKDEAARQRSVEGLRDKILGTTMDYRDPDMRIIVKSQRTLWADGVRAATVLDGSNVVDVEDDVEDEEGERRAVRPTCLENHTSGLRLDARQDELFSQDGEYRAGKWGRYLRAPDVYFDIMREFGNRFVALGEIATIRFGVKTGCDAFFMPKDVTAEMMQAHKTDGDFREHAGGAPRKMVADGTLKIIQAGDKRVHPIEAEYLKPEVHSLMKLDRPIVRAKDLDRVVLMVSESMKELKTKSPWVFQYLKYGQEATFESNKSKPVPIPMRATCAGRDPWYDLTGLVKPGIAFWAKSQQYRHIIASNAERLICNCNLYDVAADELNKREQESLIAVLNSTLVGLFKTFYGRYAGTEGNLKTEVIDVNLMEIPDPRGISPALAKRLSSALKSLGKREVGPLVEQQLVECHTPERARRLGSGPLQLADELRRPDRRELDDAVFELLGVADAAERSVWIDRLYEATARHFREIRVVEIEKQEQRKKTRSRGFNSQDQAADIWDAAELPDATPLSDWLALQTTDGDVVTIPEDRPATLSADLMYSPNFVDFGKVHRKHEEYPSRALAELVARIAQLGLSGTFQLPSDTEEIRKLVSRIEERIATARTRFTELAESRTSDETTRDALVEMCVRWFVLGRKVPKSQAT